MHTLKNDVFFFGQSHLSIFFFNGQSAFTKSSVIGRDYSGSIVIME